MKKICNELNLLSPSKNGIVRVPAMIKGRIAPPPEIKIETVKSAFDGKGEETTCVRSGDAIVVREPVIDRNTLKATGEYLYQVMPAFNPLELIEDDIDKLVKGLYALPFSDVLQFLKAVSDEITENRELVDGVRELSLVTSEHPDVYINAAFAGLGVLMDTEIARDMVENELSAWGMPGSEFLDGWVEVPARVFAGLTPVFAEGLFKENIEAVREKSKVMVRAMPTRQLHITAGNAPAVPVISALRAILSKSAAVIKSPYGATLPGALLAIAMHSAAPDHPITQNLSILYWQGGDESVENAFFMPNAFDRIVVWGAPDAVAAVRSRAQFTKTVCFNPRYGISMIGREAFSGDLKDVAVKSSMDTMIWNQKACIASQVHYVEGTEEQVDSYAEALRETLAKWDSIAPQYLTPAVKGGLKRMKRGKYINADWRLNSKDGEFSSGVVVMPGEFQLMDHPMCRIVVVRRVDSLNEVMQYLHHGVSTVGVYPEERRAELKDYILARGVTNALPLGQCERIFGGMPHDGMMVLSELVDWKNA